MNMGTFRIMLCFILAILLVFYAVPSLPFEHMSGQATGFSIIWLSFAFIVIGANLHALLLIAEKRKRLNLRNDRIQERQIPVIPSVTRQRKYTRHQPAHYYNRLL